MSQLLDLGKLRFYFAGEYNPATTYELNDVVKYGGNVYVYTSIVAAAGVVPTNTGNWGLMVEGLNFEGVYNPATAYQVGDGVAHGGKVYIAIQGSTGQTPPNPTYWSQFVDGIQYEGEYNPVTSYQKGDVVVYGGKVYIAKVDTSGNLPTNNTYWDKFVDGISPEGVYNAATAYQPGDIVAYGANLYIATANTTGNIPTETAYWDLFIPSIDARGEWATSTQYYINDVVIRGGNTFIAIENHVSGTFATDLDNDKWEKFSGGVRFRGDFAASTSYLADDLVFDGISVYIANQDFTSGANIAADSTKWDLFAAGADYLPGQVGNAGKVLSTDGTDPLWTDEIDKIYVGDGAKEFETDASLTDVIAVFSTASEDFAQVVAINNGTGASTSTDFIAYANNGDNDSGWIDMGITAQTFDDPSFTITGPNDGYIFMSGPAPKTATLESYSVTSEVATIVTVDPHGFTTNTLVQITSGVPELDGVKTITSVDTDNFTVAVLAGTANISSTPISGTVTAFSGRGDLVLATDATGSRNAIVFAAGGLSSDNEQMTIIPDETVHVEISTQSTSPTTGAFTVAGGIGVQGNINVSDTSYVGPNANAFEADAELTNAAAVFRFDNESEDASFAQISFQNADPTSSTDIIAYMNNGNDSTGWIGMGITGSEFDDTTYGITAPGDGYIFHETAGDPGTYTGNMVLATGANGSENKIIFAAGGFDSGLTQMEITPDVNVHVEIPTPSTSPTTGAFTVVGGVGISGDMNIQGDVNVVGTITFGGSGTTVETENLAVSDPFIFIANANPANLLDFGVIGESKIQTTLDPVATVNTKASSDSANTQTLGITYSPSSEPFKIGDTVVVTNVDPAFDGSRVLTGVTSNTITWENASATDISTTPATTAIVRNITTKQVFNAEAIITTSAPHGYLIGESVTITGVDATFNGTYVITDSASTTFKYAKAVSDIPSTPATTTFSASINNKELLDNVATLTTTSAHGFQNGESVTVSGVNATFDGTYTITNITSNTFSYAKTASNVASSAVSPVGTASVSRLVGTSSVPRLLGAANSTDVLRPRYSGLAKDATDGVWKLFSGATTKPSSTVNFAESGVSYDRLQVSALSITGTVTNPTDAATKQYVDDVAGGQWQTYSSAQTLVKGQKVFADTSVSSFTLTLPAAPAVGDSVTINDVAGTFHLRPLTIGRNTNKIMSLSENLVLDVKNASIQLVYSGSTHGWKVI